MNLKNWHDNADMPQKDALGWYDNETGLRYNPIAADKAIQSAALEKANLARKPAKELGGKALQGGSAKQKKWAEELRAGVLKVLSPEIAQKVLSHHQFRNTTWWIENRETFSFTSTSFGKKITEFVGKEKMEKAFERHFDRPRIVAFQKPLREVLEQFEGRLNWFRHSYRPMIADTAIISDCKMTLATDSTEMEVFSALMDRLLERLAALPQR